MDGKLLLQEIRGHPIDLVPGKTVISINPGEWTSPFEGKGFEPRGYRDFALGDNPRLIHLPTSARRGVPTVVERVALRDFKVMVVIDLTASMSLRGKMLTQHEAAATLLYAAWQAETTFGLAVRGQDGMRSFGLGIGSRHFHRSFRTLWNLCSDDQASAPRGSAIHLRRCLPPNAMLLYCSDFLDDDGGISGVSDLLYAVGRYDFVPVVIQDALEYSFPRLRHASLMPFRNPETGSCADLWVSPRSAETIAKQHEARFSELRGMFARHDIRHLHIRKPGVDESRVAIDSFFRHRRRLSS
ncbi:MAG: DUF58 domain-containing protein [Woeseiaceae bacterium]|nr:DUF58 domain-containing protein [Woeseiaceae bacterium]